MPQFKLTVNKLGGIIAGMTVLNLHLDTLARRADAQIVSASALSLSLPQPPKRFFRHGWQSWTLTTWLDPSEPPYPISAPQFRTKDEDPAYAFAKNHVSAWVGAVELAEDDILLVGALELSGRVELDGETIKAFYEDAHEGEWVIMRGAEDDVFSKYTTLLEARFGKTRFERAPRVWCSWYSLYKWINEHIVANALHASAICHSTFFNSTMAGRSRTEIGNPPKNSDPGWKRWQTRSRLPVELQACGWRLLW